MLDARISLESLDDQDRRLIVDLLSADLTFVKSMSEAQRRNWTVQYRSSIKRLRGLRCKHTEADVRLWRDLRLIEHYLLEPEIFKDAVLRHQREQAKRVEKLEKQGKIIWKSGRKYLKRAA